MLSKSRYLKGLKCKKALWLNKYKKEQAYYPEETLKVFNQGNIAGELAQSYFPGGQIALVTNYPDSKAIIKTQELIASGENTIYEATFASHNTLVAVDILHKTNGKWHAFEVKSTNSVKTEHVRDAAIQYYVMTHAGIEIEDISIMHFDRNYIRQGKIDVKALFTYESVKNKLSEYLEDIPTNIEAFLKVYQQDEPIVQIGPHCDQPYSCEFFKYCCELPENQKIILKKENEPELSNKIDSIDKLQIQSFLHKHKFPIYSFDFETIMHGIPQYDNSRPYQQIPFQYSLHYQKNADTQPLHFEFLGNGVDDPRERIIQQLIKDCNKPGDILVYSLQFEKRMLKELARDFPQYQEELNGIIERLVDLAIPYKKYIQTEATERKWSLKIVLPTFLPNRSYDNLDIQDGMATMDVYRSLSALNETEKQEAIEAMLGYCKMDTEAVLELYNLLYELKT